MEPRLQHEIDHGRYLVEHGAGQIWNWEGPAGRLRWARRVEMLTAHIRPEMKVLELGCGTGYFTQSLVKTGADLTAIDISPDLLEVARKACQAPNVRFVIENAYAMSFGDGVFDSVVGSSVLHHLEVERALAELCRVLKPGGTLFFTEPNMMNPQIAIQKNVPAIKRRLGDSPDETAFFRWSLGGKLRKAGFRDVRIDCFDFLHPKVPEALIPLVSSAGWVCEKLPVVSEIAGSLYIRACK